MKELHASIMEEVETLRGAMEMVYEEMMNLHHKVASIIAIQTYTRENYSIMKEFISTLDNIHEWTNKYREAQTVVPKKYLITTMNDKL